jgi:hypothetical protein
MTAAARVGLTRVRFAFLAAGFKGCGGSVVWFHAGSDDGDRLGRAETVGREMASRCRSPIAGSPQVLRSLGSIWERLTFVDDLGSLEQPQGIKIRQASGESHGS